MIKKKAEDANAVRALEKQRSVNRGQADEDFDETAGAAKLDDLWEKVRNCLNDRDEKGDTAPLVKNQEGSRRRFHDFCEQKQLLYKGKDTLKLDEVIQAFVAARLTPMLTKPQFKELFCALEVFRDEEAETVVWKDILNALHTRESISVRGIFPIIVSPA